MSRLNRIYFSPSCGEEEQMAERLTIRCGSAVGAIRPDDMGLQRILQKLAYYEDLEESGRLIELPCKVGDTVYLVYEIDEFEDTFYGIDIGEVFAIGIDENFVMWISARYESGLKYYHTLDEIGKAVFLTPEEAEAKLKEMKDGAE